MMVGNLLHKINSEARRALNMEADERFGKGFLRGVHIVGRGGFARFVVSLDNILRVTVFRIDTADNIIRRDNGFMGVVFREKKLLYHLRRMHKGGEVFFWLSWGAFIKASTAAAS